MCAGFHRATASWWVAKGKPDRARAEQVASARATNRVVLASVLRPRPERP